jgi:TolB protein
MDLHPAWSPDGKKIACISYRGGVGQGPRLYVMDADGSNIKQLSTMPGDHRATYPAWSPDSKKIAYSDNGPVDWEIFVVNADGSGHKQLTQLGGQNLHVSWSPDGTQLSFLHLQGGKSVVNSTAVYVMDADGGNQKALHSAGKFLPGRLTWKPK